MRSLLDQLQVLFKPISRRREVEEKVWGGGVWGRKGGLKKIDWVVFETEVTN